MLAHTEGHNRGDFGVCTVFQKYLDDICVPLKGSEIQRRATGGALKQKQCTSNTNCRWPSSPQDMNSHMHNRSLLWKQCRPTLRQRY